MAVRIAVIQHEVRPGQVEANRSRALELAAEALKERPDIMLFWMNNRGSRGHEEVQRLAWQNSMIIAASCCCGKDEADHTCRGGSNITGPDGNLLAELWDAEGVICADVHPEEILVKRNDNPWFRGRRPELYV